MGLLVDGNWVDKWYNTKENGGKFERQASKFRHSIGEGNSRYLPESNRYHLYVSLACPWAHRALIFRKLKGLENHIDVSVVHTTRVTVPVLWDKHTKTIVNNESADIIRIFNHRFNALTGNEDDYYPEQLCAQIDEINHEIYHNVNNGVYKAGFATTQEAYEDAVTSLFTTLDNVEKMLSKSRYLVGDTLTEADWRLFTTLIRFDAVYYSHFKCNVKRIVDYPNLYAYMCELYQVPGVKDTVNFTHIKQHYYVSQTTINPTQVVPIGPTLNFTSNHGREKYTTR